MCQHMAPSHCQVLIVLQAFKMKCGFLDNLYNASLGYSYFQDVFGFTSYER